MQIRVAQQHADRSPLGRPLFARIDRPLFQNARFQPASDKTDQTWIPDSMFDKVNQPLMTETSEEILQIRFQHPSCLTAGDDLVEGRQRMMGTQPRAFARLS